MLKIRYFNVNIYELIQFKERSIDNQIFKKCNTSHQ